MTAKKTFSLLILATLCSTNIYASSITKKIIDENTASKVNISDDAVLIYSIDESDDSDC